MPTANYGLQLVCRGVGGKEGHGLVTPVYDTERPHLLICPRCLPPPSPEVAKQKKTRGEKRAAKAEAKESAATKDAGEKPAKKKLGGKKQAKAPTKS